MHEFEEGDQVYVSNGNKLNRNKLDEIRKGPYKIKKKNSSTIYEVDSKNKKRGTQANRFHASKLIPYPFS